MALFRLPAALVALVAGLFLAPGDGAVAQSDEAISRSAGLAVARELCSGCHLVEEDQTGAVPDGVPPFAVIATRPGRTEGYLRAYMADPHPAMPNVPLSKRDVDNVIAYIRSFAD